MERDRSASAGSAAWTFPLFLAASGVASFLAYGPLAREAIQQPIAFNHQRHVEEGLECSACHTGCESQVSSGLPDAQVCALCHAEPQGEGAEEAKLVAALQAGDSLAWQSIFSQPPHVFFSHRRHVTVAGLECATCHGAIGESTAPPTERRALTMGQCIACHEKARASTDCTACHR
jgi:hypothetical protein